AGQDGSGIRACDGLIANCIVWGNSEPQLFNNAQLSYSCFPGAGGNGNIDADPQFVNADANDFHLLNTSPCVNTGDPSYVPLPGETDMDGDPRIMNIQIDMGVDEILLTVPFIHLSASAFSFTAADVNGPDPQGQSLLISNVGTESIYWQIAEDCGWLEVSPVSGISSGEPNTVSLSVDITGLAWGSYSCQLTVSDPGAINSPRIVQVYMEVIGPIIELSESQFKFSALPDGSDPPDRILTIRNSGGATLNWQITVDCPWLTATPDSGSSTGEQDEVVLSVDATGLTEDRYNCQLTVSDPNAENSPQTVSVTFARDCMAETHWDYDDWTVFGKPDCWCYEYQCRGDIDGKAQFGGTVRVFSDDLAIFLPVYGAPGVTSPPGICADIDRSSNFGGMVRVFSDDLYCFLPNYGKPNIAPCYAMDFNYWVTPP
ncbi:MAG: BACON domain-containing protein, partial [Planctomycetes bacterium]|nr:BACON domain-containing protein [Planctomycetota bacterium]